MIARVVVFIAIVLLTMGALLFGSAGRLDLPWLWAYLLGWLVYVSLASGLTLRFNPTLARERMQPPSDRDRLTRRMAVVPSLGHLVVAGLDARFGWSSMPSWLHVVGLVLLTVAWSFITWTFLTNRFASSAIRIQDERGHEVISTGPYALVRHPMYLGVFLTIVGSPLALGSWWAAVAISPMLVVFVRRTELEDRLLHEELRGYPEYAQRVRSKVVPGLY